MVTEHADSFEARQTGHSIVRLSLLEQAWNERLDLQHLCRFFHDQIVVFKAHLN